MNKVHSVPGYQSATLTSLMERGERSSTDSSDVLDVDTLSEDQFGISVRSLTHTVNEVAGVSSVTPTTISGISERTVSNLAIMAEDGQQNIRQSNRKERDEYNSALVHASYEMLKEELPDEFLYRTSVGRVRRVRSKSGKTGRVKKATDTGKVKVAQKCLIAGAVDYLNALAVKIIWLTEHRDVSSSVQKFSESEIMTRSMSLQIREGANKDKQRFRQQVLCDAIQTLRCSLAGLGINACTGLTSDELRKMGIDLTKGGWEPFQRQFSVHTTLFVAAEMVKALKVQYSQLWSGISDTFRSTSIRT